MKAVVQAVIKGINAAPEIGLRVANKFHSKSISSTGMKRKRRASAGWYIWLSSKAPLAHLKGYSDYPEMLEEQLRAREEDKWRMIDHWERRGCVPLTFPLRGSTSAPDPLHLPALSRAGGGGPAGSTHMSLYSGIGETLKTQAKP
ncbi:hypothetical protein Q8A67_010179 [Cirrhinus molitorella]|uniref:Uncharacterized protein n=1 Tax=Cirrhinus molitorella TaxID=172907 RepID=A0AA88Q3L2_9TELE|nr:hypothetical protein Q8A67_010179 [Cirrhinus molitorella]